MLVRGLRVRHDGTRADALNLPSLSLRSGEFVALRGVSGAGKTTALRVLNGLQPPTAGTVQVTGPRPLYLPQRPVLPHARTIADALLLDEGTEAGLADRGPGDGGLPDGPLAGGSPGDGASEDDGAWAALRAVGLAAEVAARPGGLDARLGEHGRGLSSGQRQRLALARVLRAARVRPAVLLLDEPTAHLDPAAEALVIAELRAAADRGCAVLVVAHRPALLAAVDRAITLTPPTPPVQPMDVTPAPVIRVPAAAANPAPSASSIPGVLRHPAVTVGLGAAAWLAGVTLTGAAGWLLVRAAALPPVLTLSAAVVIVRASAVARPLLRYLERLTAHEVGFARLGQWRAAVYGDLVPRVPGPGLHRRGELLSRIVEDVDLRVDGLLRGRLPAAAAGLALGPALLAALLLVPSAAPALGLGLVIAAGLAPAVAARQAARQDGDTARGRAELADAVVETVEGLEELTGRDLDRALAIPVRRGRALARLQARSARWAGTAAALVHVGMGVAAVGTAAAAATAISAGRLGAEAAAVVLLGVLTLTEPLLALPDAAIARRRGAGAAARLAALSALPRSVAEPVTGRTAGGPVAVALPAEPAGRISVRGLVAGWDPAGPPALTGLDLDLPAGGRVAVLGRSGSGKSTLAAVLAGLLDPVAGSVHWDGPAGRVAMVGDDVDHVFASTLRENLRIARPDADDDALRAVLAQVQLGDWAAVLPDGLDSWLGEGGTTMSGGERRRLVTARALIADPDLLILDEPTEGLDEPTAELLITDLLRATSGRRVLLLTHRRDGLDGIAEYHLADGKLLTPSLVS